MIDPEIKRLAEEIRANNAAIQKYIEAVSGLFTREDVQLVRQTSLRYGDHSIIRHEILLLADRIEALLPPE